MVFQLSDTINAESLTKPASRDDLDDRAWYVLLTDAYASTSRTLSKGRRVRIERGYNWTSAETVRVYSERRDHHATVQLSDLALMNQEVDLGDLIIPLDDEGNVLMSAPVAATGTGSDWVRFANGGYDAHVYYWLRVGPTDAPTTVDPADKVLSDWWLNRIKAFTRRAKSRNSWCSETDRIVAEMLGPAMESRGYVVEHRVDQVLPYLVVSKSGEPQSAWKDETSARAAADKLNADLLKL